MSTPLKPSASPDTEFFWAGLRERRLLIQRCGDCGSLRYPPRPMCPTCTSLSWNPVDSSGRGTVYSFVMPQHPRYPWHDYPYIVALIELEEGVRLVSNLAGIDPGQVTIGMPVHVDYANYDGDVVLHQFRPAMA
jgi:uncharacterized OB-fold protein